MAGPISSLTGTDNYFEDFVVGAQYEHARGKTVTEMDGVLITNMVMNTAQGHFNEDQMARGPMGQRIVFGGVTASIVVGLAMQDTGEQALAELGMTGIRFRTPVHHGDTLYAFTEVLETRDSDREDAGIVRFKHRGVNQERKLVFEGERTVLVKRRSHWADR
jgi:acyl dehydratase